MPKLLLSVRNAQEAGLALDAGVELVDVKEPSRGPLGAAAPDTIRDVMRLVNRRASTSVAYGELLHHDFVRGPHRPMGDDCPDYLKIGLSGCQSIADWPEQWRRFLELFAQSATPVAVVYADWDRANSPLPVEVIEQARKLRRAAVLIDTFDKQGPGLLRLHSIAFLQSFIDEIHAAQMEVAVAGQLTLDDALAIAALEPDYIGVRGAVCRPDRNGHIDPQALVAWRRAFVSAGRRATTSRSAYGGVT
jgi:(5-formylfuran-3-yl)methyl phosphate synthase